MNGIPLMNRAADNIRILAAAMVEKAKSGHPGGAMGGADFINVLYSEYLQFDPKNPRWEGRDRFFLDPGHMSPMLYAELTLIGKFSLEELQQLRQWGSPTPGHPEVCYERGIENSSGPLGQGHTYAIGAAIAAKFLYAKTGNPTFKKETIYTYISDGGIQEEISMGAARIAGNLGLDNLIMFYDANDIQLSTDGVQYETVYTATNAEGGTQDILLPAGATNARYVRILCHERKTDYGSSLYEVEVYGVRPSTAVHNTPVSDTRPHLILRHGQIYIMHGSQMYHISGQLLQD